MSRRSNSRHLSLQPIGLVSLVCPAIPALVLLSLVFGWFPSAALGQVAVPDDQATRSPPVFREGVTVLEVEVPVQVSRDGQPVRDLTANDFEVFDRGQRRPLVDFEIFDLSIEERSAGPGARPSGEIPEVARAQRLAARRSFLALFDFRYNSLGYAARAVTALRSLVDEQLTATDRVAIAVLGGRSGAQVVLGFTSDKEQLHRALDLVDALADLKPKRQKLAAAALRETLPQKQSEWIEAYGPAAVAAFGADLSSVTIHAGPTMDISMAAAGDSLGRVSSGISEAFELGASIRTIDAFREAEIFAESLGNLGTLLESVDGQKHALLFSQGPPISSMETRAGRNKTFGAQRVVQAMQQMIDQLGRAGWRIHTFGQQMGFNDTLFYLARETGGTSFENRGRLEVATQELLTQTSVTYVLHFTASDVKVDGRRHQLEVRLTPPREGVVVTHRPHYFAPKPPGSGTTIERRIEDAERRLDEIRGRIRAEIVAFSVPDGAKTRAVLLFRLPPAELRRLSAELTRSPTQQPGAGARAEPLVLEVLAQPAVEWPEDLLRQRIEIDLAKLNGSPDGGLVLLGDVDLPAREAELKVAVRSGERQTAWRLDVPRPRPGQPHPLPPLFLPTTGERLLLREGTDAPVTSPLVVQGRELVPHPSPTITAGETLGVGLWVLNPGDSELPLTSTLRRESDDQITDNVLTIRERRTAADHLNVLAMLETSGLQPGRYTLQIRWGGVTSWPLVGTFSVTRG